MQYAASLGMELTVTNTAATYFHDKFQLSTTTAGLIATLFGFMVRAVKGCFTFTSLLLAVYKRIAIAYSVSCCLL
jgi:nitrate/nitrite transporter NarK